MEGSKSYNQGLIDGVELWGRVCGKKANCQQCQIGAARGTGLTCQDFARTNPAKMLSILQELDKETITYFDEYCIRFPECNMDVATLSNCACRKAVFEGATECPFGDRDCSECWQDVYVGDVQPVEEPKEKDVKAELDEIQEILSQY